MGSGCILMSSKHVVIWSGGCDSTLLLHHIASQYGSKDRPVIAISFEDPNLAELKVESEREARSKIGDKFEKLDLNIDYHVVRHSNAILGYDKGGGLPQAYLWLTQALFYAPQDSTVYFGHVREDDYWHFHETFMSLVEVSNKLMNSNLSISLPLRFKHKSSVIKKLMDSDLYEDTWYCENPKQVGVPCGSCSPCKKHIMSLVELTFDGHELSLGYIPQDILGKMQLVK